MKIFLDSDLALHVENRTYAKSIGLVFVDLSPNSFDIKIAETDDTILGRMINLDTEKIENEAGVAYASVAEIYSAIKVIFIGSVSLSDASGNTLLPSGTPTKLSYELTRPLNTTAYTIGDAINSSISAKQKETISFTGTSGTANVTGAGGLTKLATFRDDLVTTAIDFESAHGAAYLAVGITLTRNMGDIILEATVSGVPFTAPVVTNVTGDLAGTVAHTTANATPTIITFANAAINNNGGGIAFLLKAESNITAMAGATLRYWFFNAPPTVLAGDNAAYINSYVNSSKRCFYVDLVFDALLAGSDTVIGQVEISREYITALADKNMYALIQTLTGFTPTSGGKIYTSLSVLKLS
jgi:hypothetical protein